MTPPTYSWRSGCTRSHARNSSSDISFSTAFGIAASYGKSGSAATGPVDRGDALDHRRAGQGDFALLERDDRQHRKRFQQLARLQQEVRAAWPAEALVAFGKGLVNHRAARRQRRRDRRQQWPVQVIADHDAVISAIERPRVRGFEVDRGNGAARPGERGQTRDVAIDGMDDETAVEQQLCMTAAAGGEIEHTPSRPEQLQEA